MPSPDEVKKIQEEISSLQEDLKGDWKKKGKNKKEKEALKAKHARLLVLQDKQETLEFEKKKGGLDSKKGGFGKDFDDIQAAVDAGIIPTGTFSGQEAAKHDATVKKWVEFGKPTEGDRAWNDFEDAMVDPDRPYPDMWDETNTKGLTKEEFEEKDALEGDRDIESMYARGEIKSHPSTKPDEKGNTSKSPAEKYAFMRDVWDEENKTGNPQGGPMWTEKGGGNWGGWNNLPTEKMKELKAIKDKEARMQKAFEFFAETDEAKEYDKWGGGTLGETMTRYKYSTGRSTEELSLYAGGKITLDELNEVNPDGTAIDTSSPEYAALRKKVDGFMTEGTGYNADEFSEIVQDKVIDVYKTTGMYEDESVDADGNTVSVKRRYTLENPSPTHKASYQHRVNVQKGLGVRQKQMGAQGTQALDYENESGVKIRAKVGDATQGVAPEPKYTPTTESGQNIVPLNREGIPVGVANPATLPGGVSVNQAPMPNFKETEEIQTTGGGTPQPEGDNTNETIAGVTQDVEGDRSNYIGAAGKDVMSTMDMNAIARSMGATPPTASSQTQVSIQPIPLSAGTMSTPTLGSTPIYSAPGAVYQNVVQTRGQNLKKAADKLVSYKPPDTSGIETALQFQKNFSERAQDEMNNVINESYAELGSLGMTANQINRVLNDPSSSYSQNINKKFASLKGVAAILKDIDAHADEATDADKTLNIALSKDQSEFISQVINGDPELMEKAYDGELVERLSEFRTNQSLLGVLTEMKKGGSLDYDVIQDSQIQEAFAPGISEAKFVERLFKEKFSDDKLKSLYDLLPAFQKEKISKKKFTDTVRDIFEQDSKPQWRQVFEKMSITVDNVPTDKLDSLPVYVENQTKDIRNNVEFTSDGATNSTHREDKNNILSGGSQGYTFYDGKEWKFVSPNDPKNLSAGFASVVEGLSGVISTSTNITDEMLNVEKALTQQGYANIKLKPEQEQIAKDNIARADSVGDYTDLIIGGITKVGLMPGMTDKNGTTVITKVIPVEGESGAFTTEVNTPDGKTQKGVIIPIPKKSDVNTLFGDDWVEWIKESIGLGAEKDILLGDDNSIFLPEASLVPREKGGFFNEKVPGYAIAMDGKVVEIEVGGKKQPFVIDQSLMQKPAKKTYDKITKDLAKTPAEGGYGKTTAMAGKDTFMYVGSDGKQKSMDVNEYFNLAKEKGITITTVTSQADVDALKDGEPYIDSEGYKIKGGTMSYEFFDKIKYINK